MNDTDIEIDTTNLHAIPPVFVGHTESEHGSWEKIVVFKRRVIEVQCGVKAPKIPTRFDADRVINYDDGGSITVNGFKMTFPDWDAMSEEDKARVHAVCDAAVIASNLYARDCAPGGWFASEPSARIYTRYIVVKQSGGQDV